MSLYSARNIPLFAIVVTPIIAATIQAGMEDIQIFVRIGDNFKDMERRMRGILWPLTVVVATIALVVNGFFGVRNAYDARVFPTQAMDWLESHPQNGNMFNYFTWGGYILYRGWPQSLVFIDGQTDFYGEALTREYEQVIVQGTGWNDILEKYEVEWVLLPVSTPLAEALKDSDWQILYEDPVAVILRKP